MKNISVIIAAAGQGKRLGLNRNKNLINFYGKPLFMYSIEKFFIHDNIKEILVVVKEEEIKETKEIIEKEGCLKPYKIPGMDTLKQVDKNINAVNNTVQLSTDEYKKLEEEKELLGKDFCRRCGYCMPCTAGIDIPVIFVLYLQYVKYGLINAIPGRYAALAKKASDCTKCGICQKRCPYSIKIIDRMEKIKDLLG